MNCVQHNRFCYGIDHIVRHLCEHLSQVGKTSSNCVHLIDKRKACSQCNAKLQTKISNYSTILQVRKPKLRTRQLFTLLLDIFKERLDEYVHVTNIITVNCTRIWSILITRQEICGWRIDFHWTSYFSWGVYEVIVFSLPQLEVSLFFFNYEPRFVLILDGSRLSPHLSFLFRKKSVAS